MKEGAVTSNTAYAVITPARDEASFIRDVAGSLARQTQLPARWIVVDNGSVDATPAIVRELAREHPWITLVTIDAIGAATQRGAGSVRAFQAGYRAIDVDVAFVANHDADVTIPPGYYRHLIDRCGEEPTLGIVGGTCVERSAGVWTERFVTGTTVWGGSRLYARDCLERISPIPERVGWDGMVEAKANMAGWTTRLFPEVFFRHHRPEGQREGSMFAARASEGRSAHYMGYRPWYLGLRAVRHLGSGGCGLVYGYLDAAIRRAEVCPDPDVREYVRRQQDPRVLHRRLLETLGRRRDAAESGRPSGGAD